MGLSWSLVPEPAPRGRGARPARKGKRKRKIRMKVSSLVNICFLCDYYENKGLGFRY